jgi:hypothetical protein
MFAHFMRVSSLAIANAIIAIGYDGVSVSNYTIAANLTESNTPAYNCAGTATNFV